MTDYRELSAWLLGLARTTDHGPVLVQALIAELRRRRVVIPALTVLERLATAVRSRARRETYRALTADLSGEQRALLDALLEQRPATAQTHLGWVRQPAGVPSAGNILKSIERLTSLRSVAIPASWVSRVHQNRLLQIAREGANTDAAHLCELTEERRYATLVATVLDTVATLTDETLEMHERFTGRQFRKAERRHQEDFQKSGRAINEKLNLYTRIGHALIAARASASDPYEAIEALLPWERFCASVDEAAKLAKPDDFDFLGLVGDRYAQLRRYAPEFLAAFEFRAAPAGEELLRAVELLRELNANNARKVPEGAPRGFIRRRWEPLVFAGDGMERRFYEWCLMAELKNALRSGDLSVAGSRHFKDFEEYLLPVEAFATVRCAGLPLAVETDCPTYLKTRSEQLHDALATVNRLAERGELPDASIVNGVLKVAPLTNLVPPEAEALMRAGLRDPAADQDHGLAGRGGPLDRILPALHPPPNRRGVAGPHASAHRHLGRCDQPRPHADG